VSRLATVGAAGAAAVTAHLMANLRALRVPDPEGRPPAGTRVSVLVPVRDEAARITPCIQALLASEAVDLDVLVLDDGSTDATADVVTAAAAGDPRLRMLTGAPLPPGWLGKPHACHQLAEAATGDVLVFVDADVVVERHGLAASVALLRASGLDLVSPYPRQETVTAAERLVQPLLQWSWLAFLPLRRAERSPRPSLAAANGQLLVCDAGAYRAAGGHAAVRDAVIEDVALARAFKAAGRSATVVDGTAIARCHMYDGWAQLRDGYAKSLWAAFSSPAGSVGVLGLLALLYLVPPAGAVRALARGRPRAAVVPALGYAAGVAGRVAAAARTGGRRADAVAHPVSVMALIGLTGLSWWRRATGRLTWRGRTLPGRGRG
jgi:hypothetical protein